MSHDNPGEHRRSGLDRLGQASETGRAVVVFGARAQVAVAVGVFVVSAWLTVSTVSYIGSRALLADKVDRIARLENAYAELADDTEVTTTAFVERVASLEETSSRQKAAIDELLRIQKSLQRRIDSRERRLAALDAERDRALDRARDLEQEVETADAELARLREERAFLGDQLETVQTRLAEVSHQRDAGRRVEQGLRWQVARLQSRLEHVRDNRETAQVWFKDYVGSSVEALESLFVGTGVDLETLVARAARQDSGQGGPYQGIDAEVSGIAIAGDQPGNPVSDQIQRLSALQKLASALPLTSPLDHFHVTSHYGKRRDPFTKNWAFHGGIDLGAAQGSDILAAAPGTVTFAGPSGAYGNMVEIDHGMGVKTRYGHLKSIEVQPGDEVDFRQPLGVIGTSGRSTARHLHYEVRVDDQVHDPAKFLEAGRYLVDVFNFKPSAGAPEVKTANAG